MKAAIPFDPVSRGITQIQRRNAMGASSYKQNWNYSSHERAVEGFYGKGAENYHDYHGGYLNFGLWEPGITEYVNAAENLVHRMATLAGLNRESILLDVGCGHGSQDIYINETFAPQRIDAVDVTWKHIESGRRRAIKAGCAHKVRFHHGTATRLPFYDGSHTHLLSIEAPEHFNTREQFFREASRVLKPGGVLALADYTLKRPPKSVADKIIVESVRRLWKVPSENVDTAESYVEKLLRTGFENVQIEEVGAATIPGYYFEQKRPEIVREITRVRGFIAGRLGGVLDTAVYKAFTSGLMEYVLVRAERAGNAA
jgi:ubiquinone/menaquinone biosynthesis C-methylase UbiE